MTEPTRVGILYPGRRAADGAVLSQAQDDYPLAERLLDPPASLHLVDTRVEEDAHREDALLRTGAAEYLLEGASELRGRGIGSAIWACTSGSFVFGLEGARRQARDVADFLDVPASSTSLAFIDACRHLGVRSVAIAGSYPSDVVALFEAFLSDAGLGVVRARDAGILSGVGVGQQGREWVFDLVARADGPDADAVLVPDTAMHTIGILDELDESVGKPVLTANQVSIWQGLVLAGARRQQSGMGALFAA